MYVRGCSSVFTRRRSIRPYQDRPVESERIDILLKAAMAAPSACNTNTT
ncbi:MAG: nitroreductase family protein, partial [Clostridia bacterium]|nr:nitroreductase family protein [Clostridia bacterium]